ncbi:hypothetical protein SH2C18_13750 [Clostridium sediminicola]|uniref:hypothetical protein n=1 Tax=Clostridium sediminicola TaxID=3114879 RepID=UPI0031F2375B
MGCGGGFHNLFRILDDYGSNRNYYYEYNTPNDINEKLMLLKHMYEDGLINDREYEKYSEYIYTRRISFDELVNIKINKS